MWRGQLLGMQGQHVWQQQQQQHMTSGKPAGGTAAAAVYGSGAWRVAHLANLSICSTAVLLRRRPACTRVALAAHAADSLYGACIRVCVLVRRDPLLLPIPGLRPSGMHWLSAPRGQAWMARHTSTRSTCHAHR
jgi:hypothetical protein